MMENEKQQHIGAGVKTSLPYHCHITTMSEEPRIPKDVMTTLLTFTVALLTLPLVAFFITRWLGYSAVWSGGSAAIVVHILLAYFLYLTFTEPTTPDLLDEKKKQKKE